LTLVGRREAARGSLAKELCTLTNAWRAVSFLVSIPGRELTRQREGFDAHVSAFVSRDVGFSDVV